MLDSNVEEAPAAALQTRFHIDLGRKIAFHKIIREYEIDTRPERRRASNDSVKALAHKQERTDGWVA